MTDYNRIVNAIGTPFSLNGTVYDMHAPDPGTPIRAAVSHELERTVFATRIERLCDGDDQRSRLFNRTNCTVEDVQRWAAIVEA